MTLVLPILLLLLLGVIEFGMLLYAHVQVANAAREAARAASLYRNTRFATVDTSSLPKCDGNIEGWSLYQTAEQAIVYRTLVVSGSKKGCPSSSTSVIYTSLGWLEPLPSPIWTVAITDTAFLPQPDGTVLPDAGSRATIELQYPYHPIIVSNLLPFLTDPIWISKAVEFEYQQ